MYKYCFLSTQILWHDFSHRYLFNLFQVFFRFMVLFKTYLFCAYSQISHSCHRPHFIFYRPNFRTDDTYFLNLRISAWIPPCGLMVCIAVFALKKKSMHIKLFYHKALQLCCVLVMKWLPKFNIALLNHLAQIGKMTLCKWPNTFLI